MGEKESNISERNRVPQAIRVTWIGFFTNCLLAILKFAAGILGRSTAMVADAIHSLSDFATDLVVIFGFHVVNRPIDETHNYGHGKFETLTTTFIGFVLLFVGGGIFWNAANKIYGFYLGHRLFQPGWISLAAAVVSILAKESIYEYTLKIGKRINSQAIIANAWHHRTDALSSIGALLGISGAMFLGESWRFLDPLAAVLVSILIIRISFSILKNSLNELMEASVDEEVRQRIIEVVNQVPGARNPHNLKTRKIGNNIAIDLHIKVDKTLNIVEAHDVSTEVENQLKEEFGQATFVSVHIEPCQETTT